VVWSMSKSQSGCVLMFRRGSGWLCRGEGGGGHSSAHSTDSTCTQQVLTNKKYYMYTHTHRQVVYVRACMGVGVHMHNTNATAESKFEGGAMVKYRDEVEVVK